MQAFDATAHIGDATMTGFRVIVQHAMPRLLAAALAGTVLYPMPAGACPELAGSYLCVDGAATYPLQLTQEDQSGNMAYAVDDESGDAPISFVADGEVHEVDGFEDVRSSTLRGWCEGDNVMVERKGIFIDADNGKEIGNIELTYAMHLDGDVLVYRTTGVAKIEGQEVPTDETARCKRKHD